MPPNAIRLSAWGILLTVWQLVAMRMDPRFMATPTSIARAFVDLLTRGELHTALSDSLRTLVFGFSAAILIGVTLGLLMGRYRVIRAIFEPHVNALYPTPRLALLPLIVLWWGLGIQAKSILVFLMSVFYVLINTYVGARDVSRSLEEVGRAFGAKERTIVLRIFLPATVPYIAAGIRLGLGAAIGGMVVAEVVLAFGGLGNLITAYARQFRPNYLFAVILVLSLLGVSLTALVQVIEKRVSGWKLTSDTTL